jgi:carboxypeptidase Q
MRKLLLAILCCLLPTVQAQTSKDVDLLVAAMIHNTPVIADLKELTDKIGGRITGSKANEASVIWAVEKFKTAGLKVKTEAFTMPRLWLENNTTAQISGEGIKYSPGVVAQPFTPGTNKAMAAMIVDVNHGSAEDFARQPVKDKWVMVETAVLDDEVGLAGLFKEYNDAPPIEQRAIKHQAKGLIYMSSRPKNLLYRHSPTQGMDNTLPIILMEREAAKRTKRLLAAGNALAFSPTIDVVEGKAYKTHNVVAEITGTQYPDEYVVIGAHLDSFDLGSGALDNGSNVVIMIDLARQIKQLGLKPKRTMRFVLYNGEEQGFWGSWAYTKTHASELDKTIMTATMDIGTGRVNGFFTNGRSDILAAVNKVLEPVAGLGPFTQVNAPIVGTDNYDFMMQGVPNLVANQVDANYASNYHGESDTFDKVDQQQLKLNSAIAGAMIYGFANYDNVTWKRQTVAELENIIDTTDLKAQMISFGMWQDWVDNKRGMKH